MAPITRANVFAQLVVIKTALAYKGTFEAFAPHARVSSRSAKDGAPPSRADQRQIISGGTSMLHSGGSGNSMIPVSLVADVHCESRGRQVPPSSADFGTHLPLHSGSDLSLILGGGRRSPKDGGANNPTQDII